MNILTIASTVFACALAAKLPSATYLPGGAASGSSGGFNVRGGGGGASPGSGKYAVGGAVNTRPQQAVEKNAEILRLDQLVEENSFQYSYETSNGIQGSESGDASQTRGGFAYKGDDGKVYSVTFTAGRDGFRPQGDHLPVPPPTPEHILEALKQNERDEAAGIFDDGKYHPENDKQGRPGSGSYTPNSGYSY